MLLVMFSRFLIFLFVSFCLIIETRAEFEPFFFVQSADTQLTGSPDVRLRFEQMVAKVNAIQPDFSVICGDLVESPDNASFNTFAAIHSAYQQPCHLTPGNHDIWPESFPGSTVDNYRARFGPDYYAFEHKQCQFIMANSVTLRDPARYPLEYEQQWTWLEDQLATTTQFRQRFIVFHHPPYRTAPGESGGSLDCCGNGYWNWPIFERQRLLTAIGSGVTPTIALCGHLHRNRYLRGSTLDISVVAGTQLNYDRPSAADLIQIERNYPDTAFLKDLDPPGFSGTLPRYSFAIWKVYEHGLQVFLCDVVNPDTAPPSPPVIHSSSGGELEWPPPADSTGALWYEIMRNGELEQRTLDLEFKSPRSGEYQVIAIDPAGNRSPPSNPIRITNAAAHWPAYP